MLICLACYENRLASVFEHASDLRLYTLEDGRLQAAGHLPLSTGCSVEDVLRLQGEGVRQLVCGAICGATRSLLERAGVDVRPWVRGELDQVVLALENGTLDGMRLRRCRGRCGHGPGWDGRTREP